MVDHMQKKIVKFNTPWNHSFLKDQINPTITEFQFEIDNDCKECDYWIIWGDLPTMQEKMSVICDPKNVIYMTDEAYVEKTFDPKFLNQFTTVISLRDDISHPNIIKSHEINTWHLKKKFKEVYNNEPIEKTKLISLVCSDLTIIPGHKKRFALVNKLIGHFKDRLDVYGSGFNYIEDKWDALAPYKYSIAIENSSIPGYFTEKISECYLAHTYPIYYGAPDIATYFDPTLLSVIDVDDYKKSIDVIERLLHADPYGKIQDLLIEQKLLYLDKYQLFSALSKIMLNNSSSIENESKVNTIRAHRTYSKHYKLKKVINYIRKKN